MPRFTTAPVDEVAPKRKQRQPSKRAQTQQEYQRQLHSAIMDHGEALVVELDDDDKPLTIRNRIKRAAQTLGIDDLFVRRRGNKVIAYRTGSDET
jgi:hypothetical protein